LNEKYYALLLKDDGSETLEVFESESVRDAYVKALPEQRRLLSAEEAQNYTTSSTFDEPFWVNQDIKLKDNSDTEIVVSTDTLKRLYQSLKLKSKILKKVIETHESVLTTGFQTGNERAIALDMGTGELIDDQIGTPNQVEWYMDANYPGEVFAIHNHPSSTPFSPVDLHSFGIRKQVKCVSVQCHNGVVYTLRKTKNVNYIYTENTLQEALDNMRNNVKNKGKSRIEIGEKFVKLIADSMSWQFMKGE